MRKYPLLSLWDRLLSYFKLDRTAQRSFELDQELLQTLQGLAEQEQRPAEDVAADLLSIGLAQQHASQELILRWQSLSPREQDVAAQVCLNLTNRQIASRLGISPETVKTHVRNVLYKFNLHSKGELRMALAGWDFSSWEHRFRPR